MKQAAEIVKLAEAIKWHLQWLVYYTGTRTQYGERMAEAHEQKINECIEEMKKLCS